MKKKFFENKWRDTWRKALCLLCILSCGTLVAIAQKRVSGTVTDVADGEPIIGANVVEKGTTNGIVTDPDGKFSLTVSDNATLAISYIGYTSREITVGNQSVLSITLEEDSKALEEVVVTALGIKRAKKALGYSTQELSADALLESRTPSVANALIGKVAGAQITESGMGITGSTRIVIRGASSLSGKNQPLWVVDGIPIDDSSPAVTALANDWTADPDRAGMASQLNLDDVESISILKGPSASALYGIRAGNGVVLVTTKKGVSGRWTVSWNSNYTSDRISSLPEMQNKYGQGTGGLYDVNFEGSWGPEMDGRSVTNFRGETSSFVPHPDREKQFYQPGHGFTNTVSLSGGNDIANVRISLNDSRNTAIVPENELSRESIDLHGSLKLWKRLSVSAKANYITETNKNLPSTGQYSTMNQLMLMARSVSYEELTPSRVNGQHINWVPDNAFYINPRFAPEWNTSSQRTDRLLGYISADLEISKTLSVSAKSGLDYYGIHYRSKSYPWEPTGSRNFTVKQGFVLENNSDVLLKYNQRFGKFDVGVNAGASRMYQNQYTLSTEAPYQKGESFFSIANGSSLTVKETALEKSTNSVYGMANFAYDDYLYLDLTARNDWASTLPKDNWSFFYPSVSLGYVFSDMMDKMGSTLPDWVTFMKLRGSWAQVGHDTDPYKLAALYTVSSRGPNGVPYATTPTEIPLSGLKPEMTTSVEVGADLRFFNNRLGLDVTYYDAKTKNQILSVSVGMASGAEKKTINAGEVENKGIEIMLNAIPIKTKDFTWDVTVNYARNRNQVNELVDGLPFWQLGESQMVRLRAVPGEPFGDIYCRKLKRNDAGQLIVTDQGLPIVNSDYEKVGNINPDWYGSISNAFSYKSFTLRALIDGKIGGDVVSMTESVLNFAGNGARTLDRSNIVVDGVTESGQKNTTEISAQTYWTLVSGGWGRSGIADEYLYDASFIKMREISLTYRFPQKWMAPLHVSNLSLALQGRNLFYILRHTPGTNPEATYGRSDAVQGWELSTLPETRSFGLNLNLTF
jgi:TonB-linked SusC/RagA family outer membrane protein